MKKSKTLLGLTAALAVSLGTWAHAQIIVASPTAPATGPNDIVNFTSTGTPNGGQDYSNNSNGGAAPGQTFATTTAATLDSVTVQGGGGAEGGGGGGNGYQSQTFILSIYSVSGSALTNLGSENFVFADQSGATSYVDQYLTLNLTTPLALSASTEYAYTFAFAPGNSAYYGFAVSSGDDYSDGAAFGTSGATANFYGYDRSFSIGLDVPEAAPEPTTWALMLGGVVALLGFRRFRRQTL